MTLRLIKLTGESRQPVWINPEKIAYFTPVNGEKETLIYMSGLDYKNSLIVRESPNAVLTALYPPITGKRLDGKTPDKRSGI